MPGPLITCCITSYNSERFVAEAIESVLAQTYRPIDVLLVDDGSTDRTLEVAAAYEDRIEIVAQIAEAGPPAVRNAAIRRARGELVALLDADDLWDSRKLERQATCLEADAALGYCVTHARVFWAPELAGEAAHLEHSPRAQPVPAFGASALLLRKWAFDRVGPFDETMFLNDAPDWFRRADALGVRGAIVPEVLLFRRFHRDSLTRRRRGEGLDSLVDFVRRALEERRSARD